MTIRAWGENCERTGVRETIHYENGTVIQVSDNLGAPLRRYVSDYTTGTHENFYYVDGEWLDNDSYWKQKEESDDD